MPRLMRESWISNNNSLFNWTGLNRGPITLPAADTYKLRISPSLNSTETFTYQFKLWNVPGPDFGTMQIGDTKDGAIRVTCRDR